MVPKDEERKDRRKMYNKLGRLGHIPLKRLGRSKEEKKYLRESGIYRGRIVDPHAGILEVVRVIKTSGGQYYFEFYRGKGNSIDTWEYISDSEIFGP